MVLRVYKEILVLLKLITNIPVANLLKNNAMGEITSSDVRNGATFMPLVGGIIGLLGLVSFYIMKAVNFGPFVTGVVCCVILVAAADVFHMESLSNFVEAFSKGDDKNEKIELLRNTNFGYYGVISIVLALLIISSSLTELYSIKSIFAIFLMPVYSRFCALLLCYEAVNIEDNGIGTFIIGKISKKQIVIAAVLTGVVSGVSPFALVLLLINIIFTFFFRWYVEKKIDGLTSDIVNASVILNQCVFMIFAVFFKHFVF